VICEISRGALRFDASVQERQASRVARVLAADQLTASWGAGASSNPTQCARADWLWLSADLHVNAENERHRGKHERDEVAEIIVYKGHMPHGWLLWFFRLDTVADPAWSRCDFSVT